ncbi:MAG: hypothetical protein GTO18_10945 [Anaerolineales bacterium]|nr:hypothetical protein [Anaerolineales bacterium]
MDVFETIEDFVRAIAIVLGAIVIVLPVLGVLRVSARPGGRNLGYTAHIRRRSFTAILLILFVSAGVLLWKPIPLELSDTVRVILLVVGTFLYLLGIGLYLWGYRTLGNMFGISSGFGVVLSEDHRLIQEGPYRIVRHPMYLGLILAGVGALMIFRAWAVVMYTLILFGVAFRAYREEQLLSEVYGDEWEDYKRRVPGWFPRFRRRVNGRDHV